MRRSGDGHIRRRRRVGARRVGGRRLCNGRSRRFGRRRINWRSVDRCRVGRRSFVGRRACIARRRLRRGRRVDVGRRDRSRRVIRDRRSSRLRGCRLCRCRLGRRRLGRRRCGYGRRSGGIHRRSRSRDGRRSRDRQKHERVEVALRIGRTADAEMDVRDVELGRTARPDRPDHRAFRDGCVLPHGDRAEMCQRDRQAVGGVDRDRLAARRNRAGKTDDSRGGREHRSAGIAADVDSAVLAAGVWMRRIERESLQHWTAHGPRPRSRRGHPEHEREHDQGQSSHRPVHPAITASVVRFANERSTVAATSTVVNIDYREPR